MNASSLAYASGNPCVHQIGVGPNTGSPREGADVRAPMSAPRSQQLRFFRAAGPRPRAGVSPRPDPSFPARSARSVHSVLRGVTACSAARRVLSCALLRRDARGSCCIDWLNSPFWRAKPDAAGERDLSSSASLRVLRGKALPLAVPLALQPSASSAVESRDPAPTPFPEEPAVPYCEFGCEAQTNIAGLISRLTSEIRSAGMPVRRACSSTASASGASYSQ
jgi:hypothetical protein